MTARLVPLFALSLAVAGVAATAASAAPHHPERIAAARQRPLGSSVTVRGTVTVPSNAFDAGFAVQQGHAGIYVLDSLGVDREIGNDVEITGTLVDSFGLLAIQPTSITAHGDNDPIDPRHKKTGQVGESTEGQLLRLRGRMVGDLVDDSPFGFKLDIDDGSGPIQIFLFPGSGVSTAGLTAGAKIDVTCFSNQFEEFFECDPPTAADLSIE
ncbi:MAG TPA: hypothetical protein VK607_17285 [Kofleriaceae bacterium]|nr:hypothetical protein [Kofleriaceae bacterium]HMG55417.1 hypothetical protein [Kofleriaceae bacterium]